jgi:CPA1 family monovalent cation:H+ antiporter
MLLLASGVAIVTKWIRLPYSIALVIVGLFIGVFHWLPVVTMTPELILLIFLPALLFEASWNLHLETLKTCVKPVALLATLGVLLSALIVGLLLHAITGFDFKLALLFGAMISATDPISVLSLFKRLRVNKRLHTILEGESLLNDGTAVALFRVLLASILLGGDLSWTKIGIDFVVITCGGMIVGAAIGAIASKLTEFFDDHLLETTLTVLVAYGSYILAEQLRVSSVISVLVAGFVMGNFGSRRSMSATTRLAVDSFWEYAAFIAESLVFLLIGMQIKFPLVVKYLPFIGAGIVAILLARIVIVYALIPFASEKKLPIPFSWRHLLFWGGLRGSLCMAMALSLPSNFPEREMLVVTTFGVALFTLLVSGLSMEPLVKVLKVSGSRAPKATELLNEIVKLQVDKKNLQKAVKTSQLSKKEFRRKEKEIDAKLVETEQFLELLDSSENSDDVERLHIETALIKAQRDCIVQLSRKDLAKPEVLEVFRERIDSRFLELRSEMQDQEASLEKEIRPQ